MTSLNVLFLICITWYFVPLFLCKKVVYVMCTKVSLTRRKYGSMCYTTTKIILIRNNDLNWWSLEANVHKNEKWDDVSCKHRLNRLKICWLNDLSRFYLEYVGTIYNTSTISNNIQLRNIEFILEKTNMIMFYYCI